MKTTIIFLSIILLIITDFVSSNGQINVPLRLAYWKSFGGANQNKLSIPLYILVDKNGIIRYAGKGGEKLEDLRDQISGLEEIKTKNDL